MKTVTTIAELTAAISIGALDADLATIGRAITLRRNMLDNRKIAGISAGDTVYFTKTVNPAYLAGHAAKVVKVNRKRIVVHLAQSVGRFLSGSPVRCPVSIVQTTKPA